VLSLRGALIAIALDNLYNLGMPILPLNNIRLEASDCDGNDFISGEVKLRITTKIPRSLFDSPTELYEVLAPVIAAIKQQTSKAYADYPREIGDRPIDRTELQIDWV
jgi:hypothetical protein